MGSKKASTRLGSPLKRVKTFYRLTKPGIIYGNILTAAAGFLLAAKGHVNDGRFVATLLGTSFVIASACVFNNVMDRDIDKKMARTRQRALARGIISSRAALTYAVVLCLAGFGILAAYVNVLVVWIGVVGFVDYVGLYDISKRRSMYGTLVGSVSGAMPIVAGYCAVAGRFDTGAWILFAIMVLWQMPHFYAIAIYRLDEYAAADIPVWPRQRGMRATKVQILAYIAAFVIATSMLTAFGYAGKVYLVGMLLFGIAWLSLGLHGSAIKDDRAWARGMFLFSLVVMMALSALLSVGSILV